MNTVHQINLIAQSILHLKSRDEQVREAAVEQLVVEFWSLTNNETGSKELASTIKEKSLFLATSTGMTFFVYFNWLRFAAMRRVASGDELSIVKDQVERLTTIEEVLLMSIIP